MNKGVSDMAIRIKNAYMARRPDVVLSYSKLNERILKILKTKNYISDFQVEREDGKAFISVSLLYVNEQPSVNEIKLHSKPGGRVYIKSKDIKAVTGGLGTQILSTNKGVITGDEARQKKVGGEILFEIW